MTGRLPTLIVQAGAAMAVLMVVIVRTVPEKADAASRFKNVTKSFENQREIQIPVFVLNSLEADPYPSNINVRGFRRGHIRDVNLIFSTYSHAQRRGRGAGPPRAEPHRDV